ncbi:unnamed protein product [Lampetra fluviatilis]
MVVCTDSNYVQHSFLHHLPIWKKNEMKNYRNKPIHHRELFEAIDKMVQNKDMKIFWKKVKGHSKIPGQEKTGNDQADAIAKVGSLEGTPWKLEDQTDRDGQQESTNQDIAVIRLVTRSGKNPAEAGTRAQLNSAQPSEDLIRMQQEDETLKTLADHIQDPAGKPITTDNLNDNKELEIMHSQIKSFWDSAEFSWLSGLDSSSSPSPLQAGKTRLTVQPAASEAPAGSQGRGLDERTTVRCERAAGATYRPGSELRQRINRHPTNSPRRQRSD